MKLNEERFELEIKADVLTFKTPYYKVERGSILHKGIYNLELASMLAAAIPAGTAFLLIREKTGAFVLSSFLALIAFILGFVLFRAFVFRRRELKFIIHKKSGSAFLYFPFKRMKVFRLADIEGIEASVKKLAPENPEGVALVEKIALHHGQIVPDFAAQADIYAIMLRLKGDSEYTLYADNDKKFPAEITVRIKEFLNLV